MQCLLTGKRKGTIINTSSCFLEKYDEVILSKLQVLQAINKATYGKYHEEGGGWRISIERKTSREEERKYKGMCLLLLTGKSTAVTTKNNISKCPQKHGL